MEWFYANENDEQIPIAEEDLEKLIRQGVMKPDTLVWNESMSDWTACNKARPDLLQSSFVKNPGEMVTPTAPTSFSPAQPAQVPGEPPPLMAPTTRAPGPADGLATASLVCGIIGVVGTLCAYGFLIPVSIASVICGHVGRKRLREADLPLEHGQLTAGIVLGWIGVGLSILILIGVLIYAVFIGAAIASEAGNGGL